MTTKLQKAIEIAVENGYQYRDNDGNEYYDLPDINTLALDPQFWEALGKGDMHKMVDHLQQAGTVEGYISSLIN